MKTVFEISHGKLLKMIDQSITWEMLNVTIKYFQLWSSMSNSDESKITSVKNLIEAKKKKLAGSKKVEYV